ncbi:glycosyltransferase family 4 protein [Gracilibacillus dipsosauri]|uniref:Glycosyl transferase family 1 n=1 Tax=Gracilibacillus dipsosauri TaxID=178340 RepID=A0A317KV43_9BACI|nr:glycosyltransferase family 4 protein [Gracilibacillus dipsosauri]PWU67173.1 glycosyl transferase family 1 [Gracilibacillus dipsosauri]
MKVLHICLAAFYIDNFSYQENLLPKYHKKNGLKVEIIASLESFDANGNRIKLNKECEYINEHGIKVKRLNYKGTKIARKLRIYKGTYEAICEADPNIIFIHGCQFMDIKEVVRYVKSKPNIKIYVDNHADFSNSATNYFSRTFLHGFIWKKCAQLIEPYTKKFYGVLPARVDFLKDVYKLPKEKVDLLLMGADDEKVKLANDTTLKNNLREKYRINKDDFLIVTGGKIDNAKKQTFLLMKAVQKLNNPKVKLLVFGSVIEELQSELNSLTDNEKIIFIGWLDSDETYKHFAIADLVVFPGRHSVFWEQVAGIGVPMLVKYWEGTTHINIGGNCEFLYEDTTSELLNKLNELVSQPEKIEYMKNIARELGDNEFSYNMIAKKSVQYLGMH